MWLIFAAFEFELIVLHLLRWPVAQSFQSWAFNDPGASFVIHYLTAQGLRPNVDFGCNFGLLGISLARLVYGVCGYSRTAFDITLFILTSAIALGIARTAARLSLSRPAILLLLAALPYAIPNAFAHGIEGALLSNALADQLDGRYSRALTLTAIACFAEPSMPFIYGLLITLWILLRFYRHGSPGAGAYAREFGPAALCAIALAIILAAVYCPLSLLHTIIPAHGLASYHAAHFSLLSSGLIYFTGIRWGWYLGTVALFWTLGSLWLFINGIISAVQLDHASNERAKLIITCAILQAAFAFVLFGSIYSTVYYFYILLIGLAAAQGLPTVRLSGAAIASLIVLALLGHKAEAVNLREVWTRTGPRPEMGGLWATAAAVSEWRDLSVLTRGRSAVVLGSTQGADLIFPGFEKPVALYLTPGHLLDSERKRVLAQARGAEVIILPTDPLMQPCRCYPELAELLDRRHQVYKGEFFEALIR